ncbi:hypothetical protein H5410_051415, partial [Solanum commersonii]
MGHVHRPNGKQPIKMLKGPDLAGLVITNNFQREKEGETKARRDTSNCVQQNLIRLGRIFGIDFQGYEEEATELLMQIDSCRQVRRMELDVEIKKIKIKGAQQLKNLVAFD